MLTLAARVFAARVVVVAALLASAMLAAQAPPTQTPPTQAPPAQTPPKPEAADTKAATTPAPAASPAYAIAWSRTVEVAGQPRLAVGNALVFLSSAESGLAAYSPTDGQRLWSTTLTSGLPPVAAGGVVAILSGNALIALDQESGAPRWQVPIDEVPSQPLLQATNGVIVAAVGEPGHELRAWSLDGTEAWRRDLAGAIVTPVAHSASLMFVGVDSPAIVALDAATGQITWRVPLRTRPSSLAAAGDRLYMSGEDAALYSYKQTGDSKPAWRFQLLEAIGQPVMSERHVYFALMDNTVRAFDRKGGSQRWSRELASRPATGPMLVGDALLVPLTNGRLSRLAVTNGALAAPAAETEAATKGLRLQAVAPSADGVTVFTIATAGDDTRTLTAWRRTAAGTPGG